MKLIITEKPSVGREYAKVLGLRDANPGYIAGKDYVVTWCVGHLVGMSYPDRYDEKYGQWNLEDLPFLPETYKYEVKGEVKDQYKVVEDLYTGKVFKDIDEICLAGDSAREGIYIQELVRRMVKHDPKIPVSVIWLDSFTEAEIKRGIRERKPLSDYQPLIDAAYARAIEDYAVGINFSRALSCKFGYKRDDRYHHIQAGRVMSCVLGMIVNREKEIKSFKETAFYKVEANLNGCKAGWNAVSGTKHYEAEGIHENVGFLKRDEAEGFVQDLNKDMHLSVTDVSVTTSKKQAPTLFNLAELQAECSKEYKISPDETLEIAQKLYERKLTTYPRTDARVLTTAVMDEIEGVLAGLVNLVGKCESRLENTEAATELSHSDIDNAPPKGRKPIVRHITDSDENAGTGLEEQIMMVLASDHKKIGKNKRYVDDSKVSDHYAIIPTGEGSLSGLSNMELIIYMKIVTRFLAIFYPAAEYEETKITLKHISDEYFFISNKKLVKKGYLEVYGVADEDISAKDIPRFKTDDVIDVILYGLTAGKTTPPKRYTSGSMILAMENAGKLIEDEELRNQIKSCGIGTSATRAEVIKKLVGIEYVSLDKKTQVLKPAEDGLIVYEIIKRTIPSLLDPEMTASWEKGLAQIEAKGITQESYIASINDYVREHVDVVKAAERPASPAGSGERVVVGKCPVCSGDVIATSFGYGCSNYKEKGCKFGISKMLGKPISEKNVRKILAGERSDLIKGFTSKKGNKFDAYLKLDGEKVTFEFPERKK